MDNNTYQYELLKSIENIANKLDPDAPKSEKETFQYRMLEAIQRIADNAGAGGGGSVYPSTISMMALFDNGHYTGDFKFIDSNEDEIDPSLVIEMVNNRIPFYTTLVKCGEDYQDIIRSTDATFEYFTDNTDWPFAKWTGFDSGFRYMIVSYSYEYDEWSIEYAD